MKYEVGWHGDPAWLAQHAFTRLLAEPHYHVPLPPPRNEAERAARAHEFTAGLAEDCHLAARLLQRQQRPDLARKVLARACKLAPKNKTYRQLAAQLQDFTRWNFLPIQTRLRHEILFTPGHDSEQEIRRPADSRLHLLDLPRHEGRPQ